MSKPKKNRVHCSLAQRSKMLFSTQEEAERFLEYNTKSLDGWRKGKVPLRAYYCVACGGWHVSSKIFPTSTIKEDKEFVDNVISSYKSQQEFTHYTSRRKTQKEEKIEKDAKMFKEMNAKLNNLLYIIGGKKCDYLCCEKLDECKNNLIEIENTLKVLTIKDEKKLASINNRIELAKEKLERGYFKCIDKALAVAEENRQKERLAEKQMLLANHPANTLPSGNDESEETNLALLAALHAFLKENDRFRDSELTMDQIARQLAGRHKKLNATLQTLQFPI